MRVLALYAHPRRESFTRAMLQRFVEGAQAAGHSVEVADLYREPFVTLFTPQDFAQFHGGTMPEDVRHEQARLERADALVFAFPVWWWSFPAILKNYIDRVFAHEWAYHFTLARSTPLLKDRPTALLCTCGSSARTFSRWGCDEAIRREIDRGTLGYCGLNDVRRYMFFEVDDRPDLRLRYLEEAARIGRAFPERIGSEA